MSHELPKLFASTYTRNNIDALPLFPLETLTTAAEYERAMLILSYLGHAYVWCDPKNPAQALPHHFAQSWYNVSQKVGRPPVLSYASYALYNWKRLDAERPIELGNIALIQNFLGGIDEEWFILIHVDIEAHAAAAITALASAQEAAQNDNETELEKHLQTIHQSLLRMVETLKRMPEHCDPYIYFNRVRPYIHGWKQNPALPNGLIYTGVAAYDNKPVKLKGETGAQSTIIPALDACFGVEHPPSMLQEHLLEMVDYMPPSHRNFLKQRQASNSIRPFIVSSYNEKLKSLYNACIDNIHEFRSVHLNYAKAYIEKQAQHSAGNPSHVGTGGTPFMDYLTAHCDETLHAKI
jgi:indoleamine 2,3-dioxygenase